MSKINIYWTPQAESDLRTIRAFIAADAPERAVAFIRRLKAAVEPLRNFPELGQIVLELDNPEMREVRVGYYRIIYRVRENHVYVMTVHHSARLYPP